MHRSERTYSLPDTRQVEGTQERGGREHDAGEQRHGRPARDAQREVQQDRLQQCVARTALHASGCERVIGTHRTAPNKSPPEASKRKRGFPSSLTEN